MEGKVYSGIYIDVNKSIEIRVHENNGILEPEFVLDPKKKEDKGYQNYVNNIKRILKCQYNLNAKGERSGIDVMLGKLRVGTISNYQKFGEINRDSGEYTSLQVLTSTEERILSQGSIQEIEKFNVPFDRAQTKTPKTDLHTHLSGALTASDMLSIGKKYNCLIPVELLERAGIDSKKYESKFDTVKFKNNKEEVIIHRVHFNDLTPEDVEKYAQRLSIKINAQETFLAMEECYDFRDPFVKLKRDFLDRDVKVKDVFLDQLRCLARHYQKTGVEYAELSTADICKNPADFAKMLDEVMPIIEREFPNVKLKFLGGIPRVLPKNALRQRNENLLASAKSPYVVGLDVMAHEVNETDHFKEIIQDCVEYSNQHDPNFVIRVHAGESAVHYDNVKQFLKTVKASLVAGMQPPVIRIGHGIHGLDNETIDLCRELGAIIEINMSSNIALDNIDSLKELDVKRYIDAGVKVCFGTDGHGMYSTDARQEAVLATAAGVTPEDMDMIVSHEEEYIARMTASAERKKGESVEEKMKYLASISGRIREVKASLEANGVPSDELIAAMHMELIDPTHDRMIDISPAEIEHLLRTGILDLTPDVQTTMTAEQKEQMVSRMPQAYYQEKYTVDTNEQSKMKSAIDHEKEQIKSEKAAKYGEFQSATRPEDKVKIVDFGGAIPAVEGKKPVFLMGYVSHEWNKLTEQQKAETIKAAVGVISSLDPKKTYIVTTCETSGFNKIIHDIIKQVNPEILVNGIIDAQQIESMTEPQRNWVYSKFDSVKMEQGHMFSYSSKLVEFLNQQGGEMVAFGEGSHLKDHIINMHNANGKIHLFNDGSGRSTKINLLQGNGYEFSSDKELLSEMGGFVSSDRHVPEEVTARVLEELLKKYASEQGKNPNGIKKGLTGSYRREL